MMLIIGLRWNGEPIQSRGAASWRGTNTRLSRKTQDTNILRDMSSEEHKNLLRVISEYLPEAGTALGADSDDVQTIRDTIGTTFKVSNAGGSVLPGDATLLSIFKKGLESLNISLDTSSSENPWASNSDTGKDAKDPVEDSPVFLKFLENVTKKGYFSDAKEGSEEYSRRYQKVLAKFKSRMDAKKAPSSASNDGKKSSGLKNAEDLVAKAEAADKEKAAGNSSLKMGDYETACEKYKKALSISPNGPSSHIYHCNLAAALSHLGKHEDAAAACVEAISLKSDYSKAYSRLGYARAQMKQYEQAKVAYEKALEFDPSSDSIRSALKNVSAKLSKKSSNPNPCAPATGGGMPGMPPGQGGMPDLSGLQQMMQGMGMGAGGGGLPAGGLAGIMNNPQFMQMAQNMMQNPQMMQMAQNMMQDPNAMAQAQQMMQGMGGGGGGMPDMSAMQNMMAGLNGGAQQQAGSSDGSGPTFEDAPDIN